MRALFEITTAADVVRAGLRSLYVYREAVSVAESVCAGVPGVTICSDAARYFTAGGFTVTAAGRDNIAETLAGIAPDLERLKNVLQGCKEYNTQYVVADYIKNYIGIL